MRDRPWEIGICGTFDVANYGDLLFPLIAESELAERLGSIKLHRFSYHPKSPREWPYQVTSVASLPEMIQRLDGLLIGGGFLIRFDKQIAPGYLPPTLETHHPTGYWLTPALLALQHNVPLVWNAPGLHCNEIPKWARPLLEPALTLSRYVSVRDEASRAAVQPLTAAHVAVIPDTAFKIARLLKLEGPPSAEFTRVSEASGLRQPYILIQATLGVEGFVQFIERHSARFREFQFLALPLGPVLGERPEIIDTQLPNVVRLSEWPNPLLLAELIGRAEAVVGHSYHLCITALAAGVPIFTRQNLAVGKYSALESFDTIFPLPESDGLDVDWFLARVGRRPASAAARATEQPLRAHWDRIAAALQEPAKTAPALSRFWQALPSLLENSEAGSDAAQARAATQARLDDLERQLTAARAATAARETRISELLASASWRWTAPLRWAGEKFGGKNMQPVSQTERILNLEQIRQHRIESEPYRWAAIPGLFSPDDGAKLAATFPCDHYKLLSARGGEKDYEYEARALIAMGADRVSYPDELSDAWRALARDLLSAEYRAVMSALTGCNLTNAPMEVNVFHYGPGANLGAHQDLPDKVVTHVLYFNRTWNNSDGGCLSILRSADPAHLAAEISPVVGNSAVIVRSDNSWHAVSRVVNHSASSRRSVTVTFYRPGSASSMWPPNDPTPLHRYAARDLT